MTMIDHEKDHVAAGWNEDHDLRWIEVGRLRLEEAKDGATAVLPLRMTWLSATELAGLSRHLACWFTDDPSESIRQIENCATFVKIELEGWDARARIDEEHPPYDKLTRALDVLLAKCRHLREVGLLAEHPTKVASAVVPYSTKAVLAASHPVTSSDLLALSLRDAQAKLHPAFAAFQRQIQGRHPAFAAFQRQLRERAYDEERLIVAWTFFKQGWVDGNGSNGEGE